MSRAKRKASKVRLSIDISRTTRERLEHLRDRSDADTFTEVVRIALHLYDKALEHTAAGGDLVFRYQDGSETRTLLWTRVIDIEGEEIRQ
jgi:hypothetical protein